MLPGDKYDHQDIDSIRPIHMIATGGLSAGLLKSHSIVLYR